MEANASTKIVLALAIFIILGVIAGGLVWLFGYAPLELDPNVDIGFGWFLFSFAAGLTMIVLPCTLPLAFVIVPLSMGKGPAKGIGIALAFSLGVALMLSIYGILAAELGKYAMEALNTTGETVKNWVYFIAGIFAYIFALGEIGLIHARMPTYTGSAPAFIQKQRDIIKAFFLGLFLGNIGVGCPHPATPIIFTRIAITGNVVYGWLLFLIHAIGRILPLLFLAFLGILGVNALSWLVARKEKIEHATGWAMVFVAGFILTLGLFSHDWWVNSGQHTFFEELTGEETILNTVIARFNLAGKAHTHGLEKGQGLFGLPLEWGNWFLVILWILPLWWYYIKKKDELKEAPKTSETPLSPESRLGVTQ